MKKKKSRAVAIECDDTASALIERHREAVSSSGSRDHSAGAMLFIIFDLEVAFLFPWAVAFKDMSMVGFWSMMVFLAVLTIGFAYEWKKGALEWE